MHRLVFHIDDMSFLFDTPLDAIPIEWHKFLTDNNLLPALNESAYVSSTVIAFILNDASRLCNTVNNRIGNSIYALLYLALANKAEYLITHRYKATDRAKLLLAAMDRQRDKVNVAYMMHAICRGNISEDMRDEERRWRRLQKMYRAEVMRNERNEPWRDE